MTHICVSELTIIDIGSDNGLWPGRCQAIIWNNPGLFMLLLIEPLGTNFSEISIGIQTFSFKKMHLNMSSAKWRPFCLGLNVLRVNLSHSDMNNWTYEEWLQNTVHNAYLVFEFEHIVTWTKWLPFCRQHFEMHFLEGKFMYFDSIFIDIRWKSKGCSMLPNCAAITNVDSIERNEKKKKTLKVSSEHFNI